MTPITTVPQTEAALAKTFLKAKADELEEVLATLDALGLAQQGKRGWSLR